MIIYIRLYLQPTYWPAKCHIILLQTRPSSDHTSLLMFPNSLSDFELTVFSLAEPNIPLNFSTITPPLSALHSYY